MSKLVFWRRASRSLASPESHTAGNLHVLSAGAAWTDSGKKKNTRLRGNQNANFSRKKKKIQSPNGVAGGRAGLASDRQTDL